MKKTNFLLAVGFLCMMSCKETKNEAFVTEQHTDANGFSYKTVTNDPTGLRLYTLENGLKVYLSRNTEEPKIQTFIPVRAGSVYDPSDNTGLAHYLEHMLFKGTDKIGTQDWKAEKVYLDKISDLYEQHKAETDSVKKNKIYKQIDEQSQTASKISIAGEYDKMISSLGAEGTNAWTWHEETVYVNKIPSNGLEKWLYVESERFSKLVLRLFHTELEVVYEEFNRTQDSDYRRVAYTLNKALFPTHPYGQQNTIGSSEHLKNPSMEAIHNYFNTYYVPNNMAVILVGDLEFDDTIEKVNKTFGSFKTKTVNFPKRPIELPLTEIVEKEVFGPENKRVNIAFRSGSIGSEDEIKLSMINMLLSNSTAGLIDLNLNKKQRVQSAGSYTSFFNDYGMHQLYGNPKSGQSLEEVKDLIIGQIEEIKKGNFDEWMIDAIINDLKLSKIRSYENSSGVAYDYVSAFVHFQDWDSRIGLYKKMQNVSKQELVDFANKFYKDNYVVVYKRQGKTKDLVKVKNPKITAVELNRGKNSSFVESFNKMTSPDLKPQYIDYKLAIENSTLKNGLEIAYIPNVTNDLAELNIIFDIGNDNNKKLGIAVDYLKYLGTDKISLDDLSKEFYKLGVDYGVRTGQDRTIIYLTGLRENISKGLALLENLWENAQANQETYNKYVLKIAKERQDIKANKLRIMWSGLYSYGQYGEESRLRDIYTIEELKSFDPKKLVEIVKNLKNYKHRIFYYGKDLKEAKSALKAQHTIPSEFKSYPEKKEYEFKETGGNVYFVNYDMVQAEMLFLAKRDIFDPKNMAASNLFNSYFGGSMGSIVFQEIRESKSLAYSAFSSYSNASKAGDPDYVYAYIGTQANKMPEAVDAMMELMNKMPKSEENFKVAKKSTLQKMAAQRITKTNIFWNYERLKKRGIKNDNREEMYNTIQKMELDELEDFFNKNIRQGNYNVMVVGNKNDVNIKAMSKLGKVQELDVDYLFNYKSP